jgi:hypothetical protein
MNIDFNLFLTIVVAILAASLIKHLAIVGIGQLMPRASYGDRNHSGVAVSQNK